jgi:uncharacterized protein
MPDFLNAINHHPTPEQAFRQAREQHKRDRATLDRLDARGAPHSSRASSKSPGHLDGLAVVYNSVTEIREGNLRLREIVRPGSMRLPSGGRDVVSRMNHDANRHLGRTASGSLTITDSAEGVRFRVRLPNTSVGHDVAELVRSGELRGCSFMFSIPDGGQSFRRAPDGTLLREITRYTLYELGPVISPAYLATTVGHDVGVMRSDDQADSEMAGRMLFNLDWGRSRAIPVPPSLSPIQVRYADLRDVRLEAA